MGFLLGLFIGLSASLGILVVAIVLGGNKKRD